VLGDVPALSHWCAALLAQLDKSDLNAALRKILAVDAELLQVGRVSYWELAPDHSSDLARKASS
jgi:hypothetical protein